jgi:outer membrane protein insertion porin family
VLVAKLGLPVALAFSIDTRPLSGPCRARACAQAKINQCLALRDNRGMLNQLKVSRDTAQRGTLSLAAGMAMLALCGLSASAQYPQQPPKLAPATGEPSAPTPLGPPGGAPPAGSGQLVVDVIIRGEHTSKDYEIQKHIHTRKDREFDSDIVQGDVRRLVTSGLFRDVKTYTQQVAGGIVVIYEVFERPRIRDIKFLGNRGCSDKKLLKEIGVKKRDPLNSYAAEESRRKIEEWYHTNGFPKATVTIFEGDKQGDHDLIFLINEGQIERISAVTFEGNTIASDAQLKTKVQSKPGWFWYLFGGKVDRTKIDGDVQTLTAYYRALGYFRARVSRVLDYDENGKWLALKFVIDEGPRYKVRSVTVEGASKFASDPLLQYLELKSGEYFNQGEVNKDMNTLTDLYGSQGHVFADVQADPRFLEEPGQLDLVYRIKEGEVFKVGAINVHIAGEFPHTRQTVILNRVSLRPGDIIDTREVRNSERRLKASQLFAGTQNDGEPPRIVIQPPDLRSIGGLSASEPSGTTVRGQSPEAPAATPSLSAPRPAPSNLYSWNGQQRAPAPPALSPPPVPTPAPFVFAPVMR